MLLENELEELSHWFDEHYPQGVFSGHSGYDRKTGTEEYNIVFELDGRHFYAEPFYVSKAVYDAPKAELIQFKKDYVTVQKRKIVAAAAGLVFN